jgi:hypothetical protein
LRRRRETRRSILATMRSGASDSSPEIEEILLAGYRKMAPHEKLRRVMELNEAGRQMALARIRATYGPSLPEREERLRLAALWLDREIMIRVFGWDPEIQGY